MYTKLRIMKERHGYKYDERYDAGISYEADSGILYSAAFGKSVSAVLQYG